MPERESPTAVSLSLRLAGGVYALENSWRFWVFPESSAEPDQESPLVCGDLDDAAISALEGGAAVLLLGSDTFPSLPTSFQPACAGRTNGNLATVIADHPLMRSFPHDGFCDWQFRPLLEGGRAVLFDDVPAPFDPIIEVVSSFKRIHKQAALFEYRVGSGRLLVCTLNLSADDPAASWFRLRLVGYAQSRAFEPTHRIGVDAIQRWTRDGGEGPELGATDMGFDARATALPGQIQAEGGAPSSQGSV